MAVKVIYGNTINKCLEIQFTVVSYFTLKEKLPSLWFWSLDYFYLMELFRMSHGSPIDCCLTFLETSFPKMHCNLPWFHPQQSQSNSLLVIVYDSAYQTTFPGRIQLTILKIWAFLFSLKSLCRYVNVYICTRIQGVPKCFL